MAGFGVVGFNNNDGVPETLIVIITIVLLIGFRLVVCSSGVVVITGATVVIDKNVPVAAEREETFIADVAGHCVSVAGMDDVAFVDDESHLDEFIRLEVGVVLGVRLGLTRLG